MASPHVAADMMQPAGMLTAGLFPQFADQTALDEFLDALLADGLARATAADVPAAQLDAAALAFAYSRAYISIWQRLSATPATAAIEGESSRSFTASQIETFKSLSDLHLAEFTALFPVSTGLAASTVAPGISNRFRF